MYARKYGCKYACRYVFMYVCMYVCTYVSMYVCMCISIYMYVCMYVCMDVCMHAYMYICSVCPIKEHVTIFYDILNNHCQKVKKISYTYYRLYLILGQSLSLLCNPSRNQNPKPGMWDFWGSRPSW